jgi:hypothetical protein
MNVTEATGHDPKTARGKAGKKGRTKGKEK